MFAGYYFADQVQRYRASPHKSRIDHVAQALISRQVFPGSHGAASAGVVAVHHRLRCARHRLASDRSRTGGAGVRRAASAAGQRESAPIRARVCAHLPRNGCRRDVSSTCRDGGGHAVPGWIESALQAHTTFLLEHRGLAARTVRKRVWQLTLMAEFWDQTGVTMLPELHVSHIQQFFVQVARQKLATRRTYGVTLRSFLRWVYQEGRVPTDLRAAVITGRQMRQAQVRDVLATEDVDRVLAAVDRSRAVGRRDYSVLLLAIRYGMRPSDIRQLRLDDVLWRRGLIAIRQAKTGRPLTLPLLPEIADALVAYLRDGRPQTTAREIFIRHRAPFVPFVPTNNLTAIVRPIFRRTGLDQRAGGRGLCVSTHAREPTARG